jgi:hypothetical protein
MGEVLLNWAIMLATFAALFMIAWLGFRDLRSLGESGPRRSSSGFPPAREWETEELSPDPMQAAHRLLVEYQRDRRIEHAQWITDERPGFIGTEIVAGMGSGILVRHLRVAYEGGRFALENRHGSNPVAWRADNGRSGELGPGETLPVESDTDLLLGDWVITCHEE